MKKPDHPGVKLLLDVANNYMVESLVEAVCAVGVLVVGGWGRMRLTYGVGEEA